MGGGGVNDETWDDTQRFNFSFFNFILGLLLTSGRFHLAASGSGADGWNVSGLSRPSFPLAKLLCLCGVSLDIPFPQKPGPK